MHSNQKVPLVRPMSRVEINKRAEDFMFLWDTSLLQKPQPFPIQQLIEFDLNDVFGYTFAVQHIMGAEAYCFIIKHCIWKTRY